MRPSTERNRSDFNFFDAEGLGAEEIERIAMESGFVKRRSGKIKAPEFLIYFCLQSLEGTVSYNSMIKFFPPASLGCPSFRAKRSGDPESKKSEEAHGFQISRE